MKMKPPLPVLLQDWIISLDESPTHPRELKLIQLKYPGNGAEQLKRGGYL